MVLEHAVLEVMPGQEAPFEDAFATAKIVISAAVGFRSLRLSRCLEEPNRYLLLVEWEQLEDHIIGFRGSTAYQEWRSLLHHFYDPFPTVDHYEDRVAVR
jgi:heme-degrading monooxygenase HmoA